MIKKIELALCVICLLLSCNQILPEETCKSEKKGQIISIEPLLYKSMVDKSPIKKDYLIGKYFYICEGELLTQDLSLNKLVKGFYIEEGPQKPSIIQYINLNDLYFFNYRIPATESFFIGVWSNRLFTHHTALTYEINPNTGKVTYIIDGDCNIENNEVTCSDGQNSKMEASFIYSNNTIKGRFTKLFSKGITTSLSKDIQNLDFELYRCNTNAICNNNGIALIKF